VPVDRVTELRVIELRVIELRVTALDQSLGLGFGLDLGLGLGLSCEATLDRERPCDRLPSPKPMRGR